MSLEKCQKCNDSADWVCIACRARWCKKCIPLQSVNGIRQKTCISCQGAVVLAAWKPVAQSSSETKSALSEKLGVRRRKR